MDTKKIISSSRKWALKKWDFLQSLVYAAIYGALTVIVTSVKDGRFHFDWATIGTAAGLAVATHLLKKLPQEEKIVIASKDVTSVTVQKNDGTEVTKDM